MEPLSRRSLLVRGSAGAAGAAAAFGTGFVVADRQSADAASVPSDVMDQMAGQPVLLSIRDAEAGEVEVLWGEREVVLTDKSLVAKVLRATS